MAKKNQKTTIEFTYNDEPYVLEYTADSLKRMQNMGFDFSNMGAKLLTAGEDLFSGAFIANHSNVMRKKRIEIYRAMAEKAGEDELIDVLLEMVNETIDEINYHEGNITWEVKRN